MRSPIKLVVMISLCISMVNAVEESGRGMINLVNMIPGETRCLVEIDGKLLLPNGMKAGVETGWFSLPEGEKILKIRYADSRDLTTEISLEDEVGTVVAIYLEFSKQRKKDGKLAAPKIRIKTFPVYENKDSSMKVVSLCKQEKAFEIGPDIFVLKPTAIVAIPKWAGAGFDVKYKGRAVGTIINSKQRSNYYVFIAPAGHGNYYAAKANCDQLAYRR